MSMLRIVVVGAFCAAALPAAASCGAAFCLATTDWALQGGVADPGFSLDVRAEWVDLDQPRAGRKEVGVGEVPRHHDEVETRNRNLVAMLDWTLPSRWSVALTLPLVDRRHVHVHNHRGEKILETWDFRGLGDARVVARREAGSDRDTAERQSAWGWMAGLKLPTGKYDESNGEGAVAERTLQPGSGTTDAVLGAYLYRAAPLDGLSTFARFHATLPLHERAGFKPGRTLQVDAGVRYAMTARLTWMFQVNVLVRGRDSGAEAEPEDSGQRIVSLAPGLAWSFGRDALLYAIVDLPVYQHVNGVQLTADRGVSAGVSWRF
jgi:hypothetical protein